MKNYILFLLIMISALATGFTSCDNKSKSNSSKQGSTTPNGSLVRAQCFVPESEFIEWSNGSFGFGSRWNDPSVVKIGSQYIMYASSDVDQDLRVRIYRFVSLDGKHWSLNPQTPVLSPSSGSAWDSRSVETPSVVYFKGQYHLFYTGYPESPDSSLAYTHTENYRIGHAISGDGITWTKDSSYILGSTCPEFIYPGGRSFSSQIPGGSGAFYYTCPESHGNFIASAPYDIHSLGVGEPGAVVFDNQILLYFSAVGANASINNGTTIQSLGVISSGDGTQWSAVSLGLLPDQQIHPVQQWLGYSTPQPVVINDKVHLFFDVATSGANWRQKQIYHAVSNDGRTGWTLDDQPIFRESRFSWTSDQIRSPAPLLDGTNLWLWFAGDNGGLSPELGMGMARCSLKN